MRLIDLTGKKFGRLTVIKRMPKQKRHYKNGTWGRGNEKWMPVMWLCKCDCGTEKVIERGSLRQGHTKSCGCLKIEFAKSGKAGRLTSGLANMRRLIGQYKESAKKRGHSFKLTEEQFKEITQQNCFYCGIKPSNIKNYKDYNGEYIFNGIDRVDNNEGYTKENTVPCCKQCNIAKNLLTVQEFKDWIKRIYNKIF